MKKVIIIPPENSKKVEAFFKEVADKKEAKFKKIWEEIERKKADGTFQEWFDKNKI